MDDDWDNDDFVAPVPAVEVVRSAFWEEEDAEEEKVKASWEDEDEPKPAAVAPAPAPVAVQPPKPKPEKKKPEKPKAKKASTQDDRLADPVAEKLRQQRLVEEADYQSTAELFGQNKEGSRTTENFIPKSEEDYLEYAELLAHKLKPFEKSFHYLTFLKSLMRLSVSSLKAADAKEVASSLTIIANEKLKAEKDAATGKKKSGPKKKQLHVDKPDDDGFGGPGYDDADDYDFM